MEGVMSNLNTYLVPYATAAEINTGTEAAKAIAPDQLLAANIRLPMGFLSGLGISHAADTDHDLTIAAGKARDATDAKDMVLASALTKRGDAEWAVGSTNGGFAAGEAMPATGTVHVWLIKRSDTGVVDVLFNDHATSALAPTLPANYDYKRRIFSLRTDGSNNIINGDQWGTGLIRTWMYDTPILDVNAGNIGTSANTGTLSIPGGIALKGKIHVEISATRGCISALNSPGAAVDGTNFNIASSGSTQLIVETNTSSQFRYRSEAATAYFIIRTFGFEDSL
jgi:hypothetical protein